MAGSETDLSSPPPPEEEEIEVVNFDRPKVIEWDDLQQELARLWSLSSEVTKARERKESLSHRIESIIQAEKEPLRWQNELEEMRKKLEAKKLVMGDLLLRSKRTTEDVRTQREELSYEIRWLLVASKTLGAARQQLQEARRLLAGDRGHGHLKNLRNMLRTRQQYMMTQVSMLYAVKSSRSQRVEEYPERDPINKKSVDHAEVLPTNASKSSQISSLSILGLQPVTPPLKRMSFFGDKKEAQMSATALGYVAHAVLLTASYLDVPLRYSLRLGGSRSYVHDFAPCIEPTSDLASSPIIGTLSKPTEFPLFLEGQDTTRAAYAIFLLNKDLEQLLNHIGGRSMGPRHVLGNLKELIRIVRSPEYINE